MISGAKGGGKGGSGYTSPVEADDSLQAVMYAKIVDVISEGEIEGIVGGAKGIYLDGLPLQNENGTYNFEGVSVAIKYGTPIQEPVDGLNIIGTEVTVNTEISHSEGSGSPGPYIFTINDGVNESYDAVYLKIQFPQLFLQDTSGVLPTEVELKIEKSINNGTYTLFKTEKITGKTSSTYERQINIPVSRGEKTTIRVSRITMDDSERPSGDNKKYVDACKVSTYTKVITRRFRYPDTAYAYISIDASQFGDKIPQRSYLVKGIKVRVPSNYNPVTRAYTGNWNGSFTRAWTDNPAWILLDLLTNSRYGLGYEDAYIDTSELYAISRYCDELVNGGTEPRFTFNSVISSQEEAATAIQNICAAFRSISFYSATSFLVAMDKPTTASRLVTNANVVDGEFSYSSSPLKDRHSAVLVTYNEPTTDYDKQVEIVEDVELIEKYGWKPIDVVQMGCTSKNQAHRYGRAILADQRYENEVVKYTAGSDHADILPGDVIIISDLNRTGLRYGGRVISSTSNTLTLDLAEGLTASDKIKVTNSDLSVNEYTISSVSGNTVVLSSTVSCVLSDAIWIVKKTQLANFPEYRVSSIVENENLTYSVTATKYFKDKYAYIDSDVNVPETLSYIPANFKPKRPKSLAFSEQLVRAGTAILTKIDLSWEDDTADEGSSVRWLVKYRVNSGNWEQREVATRNCNLGNLQDTDSISVEVYAKSIAGRLSTKTTANYTVVGKLAQPKQVTNFTSTTSNNVLTLKWDASSEIDVVQYVVYYGTGTEVYRGASNFVVLSEADAKTPRKYYVKCLDTSGNYSAPSELNYTYNALALGAVTLTKAANSAALVADWADPSSASNFSLSHYVINVKLGSTTIKSTTTRVSRYQFDISAAGTYAVEVTAVDTVGNNSSTQTASYVVSAPSGLSGSFAVALGKPTVTIAVTNSVFPIVEYSVSLSGKTAKSSTPVVDVSDLTLVASTTFSLSVKDSIGQTSTTSLTSDIAVFGTVLTTLSTVSTDNISASIRVNITSDTHSIYGLDYYLISLQKTVSGVVSYIDYKTKSSQFYIPISATDATCVTAVYVSYVNMKGGVSSPQIVNYSIYLPTSVPSPVVTLRSSDEDSYTIKLDWQPVSRSTNGFAVSNYVVKNGTTVLYTGKTTQCYLDIPKTSITSGYTVSIYTVDTLGQESAATTYTINSNSISPTFSSSAALTISRSTIGNTWVFSWPAAKSVSSPTYKLTSKTPQGVETVLYQGASRRYSTTLTNDIFSAGYTFSLSVVVGELETATKLTASATYTAPSKGISDGSITNVVTTTLSDKLNRYQVTLAWGVFTKGDFDIAGYVIHNNTTDKTNFFFKGNSLSAVITRESSSLSDTFYIYAFDTNGVYSSDYITVSYTASTYTSVRNLSIVPTSTGFFADWDTPTNVADTQIAEYLVKVGTAEYRSTAKASQYRFVGVKTSNSTNTVSVKARLVNGEVTPESTQTYTVSTPRDVTNLNIANRGVTKVGSSTLYNVTVSFTAAVKGSFDIARYEISYGTTTVTTLSTSKELTLTSSQQITVKAVDIFGNKSAGVSASVDTLAPEVVNADNIILKQRGASIVAMINYDRPLDFAKYTLHIKRGTEVYLTAIDKTIDSHTFDLATLFTTGARVSSSGITYTVSVKVYDRAGNSSSATEKAILLKV